MGYRRRHRDAFFFDPITDPITDSSEIPMRTQTLTASFYSLQVCAESLVLSKYVD